MSEGETRSHVPFLETTLVHYRQDGHVQTSITVFLAGCMWHRFCSLGKGPIQRLVIVRNCWKCIPYSGKIFEGENFQEFRGFVAKPESFLRENRIFTNLQKFSP